MNNNDFDFPCVYTYFNEDGILLRFHCHIIYRRNGKRKYYFSHSDHKLCTFEEFRNTLGNFYYDFIKRSEVMESFVGAAPGRAFSGPLPCHARKT